MPQTTGTLPAKRAASTPTNLRGTSRCELRLVLDSRIHCASRITSKGLGALVFILRVRTPHPFLAFSPLSPKCRSAKQLHFKALRSIPEIIRESIISAPAGLESNDVHDLGHVVLQICLSDTPC